MRKLFLMLAMVLGTVANAQIGDNNITLVVFNNGTEALAYGNQTDNNCIDNPDATYVYTYDSSTGELFRDGTRLTVLEGFASAFDGNFYSLYSVSSNGFSLVARGSSVDSSRFLCNNPPELGAIYVNGTLLDSNEVTITYPENLTITVDAYDVENGDDLTMELFIQNDSQGTAPTTHSVSYVTNNS